jgi:metal-dependent amidase/aminoacylase/carboxypeptidase family protein
MDKNSIIEQSRPELAPFEEVYRDLHRNPELSLQEVRTAGIVAKHLESLGEYRVITGIGGHGVVGVLENGPGATVLLRADMDALPHLETTGLEYASKKIAKDRDGKETPIMHA